MIDAVFVIIYIIFACITFSGLVKAVGEGEIGFHKRSDKPEHPSDTIQRVINNLTLIILGTIFFPVIVAWLFMAWYRNQVDEYNEAKGLYERKEQLEKEIERVHGQCVREPLTFNELDKPMNEDKTFSNTLKERYIQAIAEGDWELVEQLEYEWGMDIFPVIKNYPGEWNDHD